MFTLGFTLTATIAADVQNYNLRAAAVAAGWNQTDVLTATVTINVGVVVRSSDTATPAFATGLTFPAGTTLALVNNGSILGAAGAGGVGGAGTPSGGLNPGLAGLAGADAVSLGYALSLTNRGAIYGGGGGGGGGSAGRANSLNYGGGGGGGGGAGNVAGSGGARGAGAAGVSTASTAGSTGGTVGGIGGDGATGVVNAFEFNAAQGGSGGGYGLAGFVGNFATVGTSGGVGGIPGYAVRRNGSVLTGVADGTYSSASFKGSIA